MAKNVIIGILSLLVVALVADSVWLHINCRRQQENIAALAHDGDFKSISVGKLALNDVKATTGGQIDEDFALSGDSDPGFVGLWATFNREKDYTLPIIIAHDPGAGGKNAIWSTIGEKVNGTNYLGYSSAPHIQDIENRINCKAFPEGNPYVTIGGTRHYVTGINVGELSNALFSILDILATFRQTYLHIGKAGMVIGVDGNKSASGITRRTDPPAQQDNP